MNETQRESFRVLRAQSGDREAFDQLLAGVEEPLFRYVSRLVGDREMGQDILQDVFTIVYRKLTWLEKPELFRAWVFRIASREAFKCLKRERRWIEQVRDLELLEALPAPSMPSAAINRDDLARFVSDLSPASRAVLILHYYEEMTLMEIADVLEVALGTVKSRLAYGLECLRRALAERESHEPAPMESK